jgi:DNA topoisomerase-6 subunit B
VAQTFEEISAADFFYRNRDIAGFTNPSRAIFVAIRELVENSLDAAESHRIAPEVYVRLSYEGEASQNGKGFNPVEGENEHAVEKDQGNLQKTDEKETAQETQVYKLRVEDNGTGVPPRHIPSAFGQILFGSKYKLKQQRGTFGLGGKMAILYGQITTHQPATVISSTGISKTHMYKLMIDIQRNRPLIMDRKVLINKERWRGTVVEFTLEGDYFRAMPKILDYFKQTAMVNPYANLTFVDPKGRLYKFTRVTKEMPVPPKETKPHPYGVDVELLQRLIQLTPYKNMLDFLRNHFHRVGDITAQKFLDFANLSPSKNPKRLDHEEIVRLMHMLKKFKDFLPPDASCLSPLGEDLLRTGILKEIRPEFVAVHQRKPATYSGHPFVIEIGIAYGGEIPARGSFTVYRFANRIPLLYDEANDVSLRVIEAMNWRRYHVAPDMPVAIAVHICSTKVPYKTVGKEFIADRPEVRREIANGLREVARQIQLFLSRREHVDRERKRLGVFSKYLPRIAQFSTELAGRKKVPDIEKLLASVRKYGSEEA